MTLRSKANKEDIQIGQPLPKGWRSVRNIPLKATIEDEEVQGQLYQNGYSGEYVIITDGYAFRFPEQVAVEYADFGSRVKYARRKMKLSQNALAQAIDTSKNTIESWESGRRKPRPIAMRGIAAALKVEYEWLVDGLILSN